MYPHERSLVEKYRNEPFAIVGVNSDSDRELLKKRMKEENITWRSFFDGSTDGPIAKAWNVHAWPTIYVLDADGVIRFKNVRGKELDRAIETLLEELRAKGRSEGAEGEES